MITRRGVLKGLVSLGASGLAFGAYAIGIEPMLRLEIARYRLTPPGWPADLKLRIVALADIHASEPWMTVPRVAGLVERANGLGGDLIVLLGDYVSGKRIPHGDVDPQALARALASLRAPLGVHAVLGNHDWWEDAEAMRLGRGPTFMHRAFAAAGIPVLENDASPLTHHGRRFWLAGLGDQWAFHHRRIDAVAGARRGFGGADDLPGTLARLTDDAPAILLAHEPDIFPQVPSRFCLTLSGHTHGGQVNLLGWRPAAASRLSRRYARGHFHEGGRDLVVSSGLGCSFFPIRVGVPPEIMLVELGG
ncbi:MAG: metallophosphoesterase [Beijerinckiaceae bacterium]